MNKPKKGHHVPDKFKSIKQPKDIIDLIDFLNQSPTAWHAVHELEKKLKNQGFIELLEEESWQLKLGSSYYVKRNGSSLCAFRMPFKDVMKAHIMGSHSDSPSLKIKPNAEFSKEGMIQLGVEVYGSPLLTSWMNRDLVIAGKIVIEDQQGEVSSFLVHLKEFPLIIPQLAIHLDRNVNEQGLILNKQDHLNPIAGLEKAFSGYGTNSYLSYLLNSLAKNQEILGFDLFLVPLEEARLIGLNKELIASYRIDNLVSVHASFSTLLGQSKTSEDILKMAIVWDNEEVGSGTSQGADSNFLAQILERIVLSRSNNRENLFRLLSRSYCVSIDQAHAVHPNHIDKHDARHHPILGEGIVLKTNALQRYASDSISSGLVSYLCKKAGIPFQAFSSRNDMPCGTTIGPITAMRTGIRTFDIGCPQLSMHSIREIAACQDYIDMCQFLNFFLEENGYNL